MARGTKKTLLITVILLLAGCVCGLTLGVILAVGRQMPQIQALENFEPGAATRILADDGRLISELYVEKRLPRPLSEIPPDLRKAVIAVEDRRFHHHPGLDVIRNFGALWADIRAGGYVQGASTITQQLVKNLFLTSEKTLTRKLKEVFLALQVERRYTKDEILHLYLNQIYLGAGNYGVGAAAQYYFGKDVSQLTLDECTLLAGLPKSPEQYQPFKHPDRAKTRRRIVLQAMLREGFVTPKRAEQAAEAKLDLADHHPASSRAPHFSQLIRNELVSRFGQNAVYKGGLTVTTTLDMDLQQAAWDAVQKRRSIVEDDQPPPQAALIALSPGDGGILAYVGGANGDEDDPDRLAGGGRQPGSAIKPFIYALAVEKGLSQAHLIWDAPVSYDLPDREQPWRPQNFTRRFEGEITMRRALEVAGRIPSIKLLSRVGVDNLQALTHQLGITADLPRDLTLALGEAPVTATELTAAYNALAGKGLWAEPYAVMRVEDRNGRVIYRAAPERRAVLSPEAAYIVTDMLTGVIRDGVGQRASILPFPAAGMSGATDDHRDAWFIGYSPTVTAGVWVGHDDGRSLGRAATGANTALPIWMDFMQAAGRKGPVKAFDRPAGVVMAPMDRFTGLPARPGTPGYVLAAFRQGAQPQKRD